MTDEELIARLRDARKKRDGFEAVMLSDTAADRIEALVKESAEMEAEAHAHIELWGKALREKAAVEARAEQLEATLEAIRPVWAQGWSNESLAAQASASALAQLWQMLGASNQTEAVTKLNATLTQQEQRDWRSETTKTEDGYNG